MRLFKLTMIGGIHKKTQIMDDEVKMRTKDALFMLTNFMSSIPQPSNQFDVVVWNDEPMSNVVQYIVNFCPLDGPLEDSKTPKGPLNIGLAFVNGDRWGSKRCQVLLNTLRDAGFGVEPSSETPLGIYECVYSSIFGYSDLVFRLVCLNIQEFDNDPYQHYVAADGQSARLASLKKKKAGVYTWSKVSRFNPG
jgi:hypothetical protein